MPFLVSFIWLPWVTGIPSFLKSKMPLYYCKNFRAYHNGEFAFYAVESGLTLCVFISTMVISPLKSDSPSVWESLQSFLFLLQTWNGFSRKAVLIFPYIWPRKSYSLQLRVAFCLFLLVFGRLINVALPLYGKWIVDSLANPAHFDYSLIYISTFLKFLQGNGAMGGFLNTLRSYCKLYFSSIFNAFSVWIPIQQYTTRELEVSFFLFKEYIVGWTIRPSAFFELEVAPVKKDGLGFTCHG